MKINQYVSIAIFGIFISTLGGRAMAADKDNSAASHWMPVGMLSLNATNTYDTYGPNLKDIRITQLSDSASGNFLGLNYQEMTSYLKDTENTHWFYTDDPDWDNPVWARTRVLAVGEAFETQTYDYEGSLTEYKWCNRHTPFLVTDSQNACGLNYRGIDCSNFTAFIYNFALGHRSL